MANLRPFFFMMVLVSGFLMWWQWQQDYNVPKPQPTAASTVDSAAEGQPPGDLPTQVADDLPTNVSDPAMPAVPAEAAGFAPTSPTISVRTDVLDVDISLDGGSLVAAQLLDYPVELKTPDKKVELFTEEGARFYVAQSGLWGNSPGPTHQDRYQASSDEYVMSPGADTLIVPLTWIQDGVTVTKTFTFRRGDYLVEVAHEVTNNSGAPWIGRQYQQLQRTDPPSDGGGGFTDPSRYSFMGVAVYTPEDKLTKIDFEDVREENYSAQTAGGWLAMIQHYFFSAWVPVAEEPIEYTTSELGSSGQRRYLVRGMSAPVSINQGGRHRFVTALYAGPKIQDHLDEIAPGLSLTVDYGIFTILSKPLFWVLNTIHKFVGNWGWSIILLTVLIKLVFFKLTEAQYRSMARMRKLQPRIEALKERFGDDRAKMSQAMMEMYKKEKVNPLGGCLPILVQIPIFISLYWVLLESVELRQAPFILWLDNLSLRDPYFVLPALNGIFMILTQRMTPTPGMDPMQRKVMQSLPIVFSVMFAFFPAGLVLYWATNAGLGLLQQWVITRRIDAQD